MSQVNRTLLSLLSGEQLTANQIRARFSAKNPHEVIRQIRQQGYAVYLNERTNSKGETKGFYRIGNPTRSMISSYYKTFGA